MKNSNKKYIFFILLIFILLWNLSKNNHENFNGVMLNNSNNLIKESNDKKTINIENLIIISCIFGTKFKKVHPCPYKNMGIFFTNNKSLKKEIISKSWIFVYVNKPLTNDIIISSLQSKYIKFLKFLDSNLIDKFPKFKNNINKIIYVDHKEHVKFESLNEICNKINNNLDKSLIIRQSPGTKDTIFKEINAGMGQYRYRKNMKLTKEFVNNQISLKKISKEKIICNTGLLIYINHFKIKGLIDNVYKKCIEHQQPECQIYWAVFSQKYKNEIKEVDWDDIKKISRYNPY